ncbi:hypothetical protein F8S13_25890 [Chloroflexia bacterium SDU3-3]|nr:hypothetical protein F8S13_25890 [Chloroflexia bacterium SDU3-3]
MRRLTTMAAATLCAAFLLGSSVGPATTTEAATSVACTRLGYFQDDSPSIVNPDVNFTYTTDTPATGNSWVHATIPGTIYNTISYSNSPYAPIGVGDVVKFTLNCVSGFEYYYSKAYNHGYAYVYANGVQVAVIDQYSATIQYQQHQYIPLPPGIVEVTIEGGNKNPAATDFYFDIDGIIPK